MSRMFRENRLVKMSEPVYEDININIQIAPNKLTPPKKEFVLDYGGGFMAEAPDKYTPPTRKGWVFITTTNALTATEAKAYAKAFGDDYKFAWKDKKLKAWRFEPDRVKSLPDFARRTALRWAVYYKAD